MKEYIKRQRRIHDSETSLDDHIFSPTMYNLFTGVCPFDPYQNYVSKVTIVLPNWIRDQIDIYFYNHLHSIIILAEQKLNGERNTELFVY